MSTTTPFTSTDAATRQPNCAGMGDRLKRGDNREPPVAPMSGEHE